MIVNHINDRDCSYLFRVSPSVSFAWERIVINSEYQPIGMDEINGILLIAITSKLVPPIWWGRRHQS